MTEQEVEIRVIEPHKAEGIKELCLKNINNPDTEFVFLGAPNVTLGQRREELLRIRQQAQSAMATLEKESEEILKGNGPKDEKTGMPLVDKNAILEKYEQYLSEENIQKFKDSIANYPVEDFRKEVCTTAVESDPSIFSKRESQPQTFFKCDSTNVSVNESGAIRILNQYKNGGNK